MWQRSSFRDHFPGTVWRESASSLSPATSRRTSTAWSRSLARMRSWAARSAAAESAIAVLLLEVIEINLLSEQVLVEPVRDVLQPRDAVGRLPRTRQLVILAREGHHDRDFLLCFQCPEHRATSRARITSCRVR